jgi:hypothetical protein
MVLSVAGEGVSMSPRPVNPTPPILLAVVSLLFAMTWDHDRVAPSGCLESRPAASVVRSGNVTMTTKVQPVNVQPVTLVAMSTSRSTSTPLELALSGFSDADPPRPDRHRGLTDDEASPTSEDWVSRLSDRAQRCIVR